MIKAPKSVPQTWPCFLLADQGFWLFINNHEVPLVLVRHLSYK